MTLNQQGKILCEFFLYIQLMILYHNKFKNNINIYQIFKDLKNELKDT